jgi:hypothetical protein
MARARNKRNKSVPKDDGEFIFLKLRRDEYKLLLAKMREVAAEAARAHKRSARIWKEIERTKAETRKALARLGAT